MPKSPVRPWQPDPNQIASGKPGAVHTAEPRSLAAIEEQIVPALDTITAQDAKAGFAIADMLLHQTDPKIALKSLATERRLFEVLARPYFVPLIAPSTYAWLRNLLIAAEAVTITERIAACRDPADDKFLEPAVTVAPT